MADPDLAPRLSYALSPAQARIFLEDELDAAQRGLNLGQIVCSTTEAFNLAAFTEAWQTIANRNAALGVAFTRDERQRPYQRVYLPVEIPVFMEHRPETAAPEKERFIQEWLAQDRRHLFDLSSAPLTRVGVFCFADQSVTWIWTFHQILMDDRSAVLVLEDFFACYEGLCAGQPSALSERRPFGDFIAWHQEWTARNEASDRRFWQQLISSDEIDAMLSIKDTAQPPDFQQAKISLKPDEATAAALTQFAAKSGLSLKTIVEGAWALLLSRYYRSGSVTFGTIRFSRSGQLPRTESMIGTLMNFLPVHAEITAGIAVTDFLRGIQKQQTAMRDHRWTSLDVIRSSIPVAASKQLFDSCVVQQRRRPAQELADRFGRDGLRTFSIREASNLPLLLSVSEQPQLNFDLVYQSGQFERPDIEQMGRSFLVLLAQIPAAPQAAAATLGLLDASDRSHVLRALRGPDLAVPEDRCLHHGFEEQARRTPLQTAVIAECTLTYEHLDRRATALAVRLNAMGIGAGRLVAIFLPRSSAALVAILGVLKSGAAYFPLDVALPRIRLQSLLEDAQAAAVVTDETLASAAPELGAPMVLVNAEDISEPIPDAALPVPRGSDLAYAISTSGTTGRPKLIGIEHRQAANLLAHATQKLLRPEDVRWVPFIDLPSFDSSVSQIFTTLTLGGTLVCVQDITEIRNSPFYDRFTCLGSTPSLLAIVLSTTGLPPAVRTIGLGAEAIPPELLEKLDHLPQVQKVINYYGPSEATVYCTLSILLDRANPNHVVDLRNRGRVIGRPIANTQIYVVDDFGQLAPPGVPGELCVAGAPVARGYLNAVGDAARNFLSDPFQPNGGRMYRSGDIVCLRSDGQLTFNGRRDHQLKFNGVRIEAAEIESALEAFPGVHQAIVHVRRDLGGVRRLVAYLAAEPGAVGRQELRRGLRQRLPDAMIPHQFLFLPRLPLLANGKVDRDALSSLELETAVSGLSPATLTTPEKQMVTLWEKNLGRALIGLNDDYFELGGDSLSAVNLVAAVQRQFGLRLKISILFDHSSVAELLAVVQEMKNKPKTGPAAPACSLVCLQPQGEKAPLIILPGGSGTSYLHYKNFGQKFAPNHPVHVLQAGFSLMMEDPAEPIAHIARNVAQKILDAVNGQPFVLFGHCIGGLLAWHVACLLKNRNAPPFRLVLYDAPTLQSGAAKPEDADERAFTRLQLLIKAYRPAWEEWRMDHGEGWWQNVTFVYWMFTHFLVRRGWVRSHDQVVQFVKLSYLRLLEKSPLDSYAGDVLLVYHHAQASQVSDARWRSICGGELRFDYIPGHHRVWQTSILALRPRLAEELDRLNVENSLKV